MKISAFLPNSNSKSLFYLVTLFIFTFTSNAGNNQSKDWIWNVDGDEYFFAGIENENSDHFFGQYCYFDNESCYYLIAVGITCEKDSELPALLNSDKGSLNLTLICAHVFDGQNVMFITPFDDIDLIVRRSNYFRIALPMENDQFKVVRFSLGGSTYAIDLMRAAAEKVIDIQQKVNKPKNEEYL